MNKKITKRKTKIKVVAGTVPFKGSVDAFLNHCSKIDIKKIYDSSRECSDEESLAMVMDDFRCSRETALEIIEEIKLRELKTATDELIESGLIEVVSYDSEGIPQYQMTELGESLQPN